MAVRMEVATPQWPYLGPAQFRWPALGRSFAAICGPLRGEPAHVGSDLGDDGTCPLRSVIPDRHDLLDLRPTSAAIFPSSMPMMTAPRKPPQEQHTGTPGQSGQHASTSLRSCVGLFIWLWVQVWRSAHVASAYVVTRRSNGGFV